MVIKYRMPAYYQEFECIGGRCEDTCCAGWNIEIDAESLNRYREVPEGFGECLKEGIDWKQGVFCLNGRRCSFLNEEGLCAIYKELGKDALCNTCRTYPRHLEDYGELRETMLSLTCPEAARLILADRSCHIWEEQWKEVLRTEEEKEQDPNHDLILLIQEVRKNVVSMILERSMDLNARIAMVLSYVHDVQRHFDQTDEEPGQFAKRILAVEAVSKRYMHPQAVKRFAQKLELYRNHERERWIRVSSWMRILQKLEPVLEQWERKQGIICTNLYHRHSYEEYCELQNCFEYDAGNVEQEWENLFLYFIHSYLLGACYDECLYSKVKLAVMSYVLIREWCLFRYERTGEINRKTIVAAAYRYAREMENSDANLEKMEEALMHETQFFLKPMLTVLVGAGES